MSVRLLIFLLVWLPSVSAAATLRVGVYANPPKVVLGADQQPSGIFGDLILEIARREQWSVHAVPCEWSECLEALKDGRIDVMPDVAFTEARAQVFSFHQTPVLHNWSQVYARSGSVIQSLIDLNGKRMAVLEGSVQHDDIRKFLAAFGVVPVLVPVKSLSDGFALVANGSAEVAIANNFFGVMNAHRHGVAATPIVMMPNQLYFAVGKGAHNEFLTVVDRYLDAWKHDPKSPYAAALSRWLETPARRPLPPVVWWTVGVLTLVSAAGVFGVYWLRRRVRERTVALVESETRLTTILDNVDGFIYLKDKDGRYLFANRAVRKLWGLDNLRDVVGRTDAAFFDAEAVATLRRNDRRVLIDGEHLCAEEILTVAGSGKAAIYESNKLPLRHDDGTIYALCGISIDITERRRREADFQVAMTLMPVPVGIANTEGAIVFLNTAFIGTYGYSISDVPTVGVWLDRAYPDPAYRLRASEMWSADVAVAVATGDTTPSREYEVTTKAGRQKQVLITMRPIGEMFVTVFEDITQRRKDEVELKLHREHMASQVFERTRELGEKNAALETTLSQLRNAQDRLVQSSKLASLGELVAGIAHELNTPIGNAKTLASTLRDRGEQMRRQVATAAVRRSELLAYVDQAGEGASLLERNLDRAAELLQSFKHVAVDRASSQRRKFDLDPTVHDLVATLHPMLKRSPVAVVLEIEPDLLLDSYPGPLGQVLVNLVQNALVHAFPEGAAGTVRITGQGLADTVEIRVRDDGQGIEEKHLRRVFDPFFTTRLGQGGSGLGLNIAYNIVTGLLGGTLSVESRVGQGSCFVLRIPKVAPENPAEEGDPNLPVHPAAG